MDKSLVTGKIIAILTKKNGDVIVMKCHNIVTDKGDTYYAQKVCGETPTNNFAAGGLRLGTGSTAPTKSSGDVTTFLTGSGKAKSAGYPKTADADPDNTGAGADIASWTYEYTTSEANGTGIAEGAIVDNIASPTGALTHFLFPAPFDKTASDTLKVVVNHQFNGV